MVPEFTYFMLPLLEFLSDKKVHSSDECVEGVSRILNLTTEDLSEKVKKGNRTKVVDRTQWSKTYLSWAELVRTERRGHYIITDKGLELLASKPEHIDRNFLIEHYPEFAVNSSSKKSEPAIRKGKIANREQDPAHSIVSENEMPEEILSLLKASSPAGIARILCKVLGVLGYRCEISNLSVGKSSIQGRFYLDTMKLFPAFLFVNISGAKVTRNDVGQVLQLMYDHSCNTALYLAMGELAEDASRFCAPSANIKIIDAKYLAELIVEKGIGYCTIESKVLNPLFFTE